MTVDFVRHTWQDWPSTETPITADELNRLEEGIAGLYSDLDGIDLANIEQTVDDLEEAVENFKAGVEITQEEYDNLTPEEKNNGTVYYITDAPSTPAISALDASYNNSTSGLQATNVQSAIDEVQGEIDELNSNFAVIEGTLASSVGYWSSTIPFPSGFTKDNTVILTLTINQLTNGDPNWRVGNDMNATATSLDACRQFAEIVTDGSGIRAYNTVPAAVGHAFRCVLMKTST